MRDGAGATASESGATATSGLFRFDPGWLFVLGGAALLSCLVVIPAQEDLRLAHDAKARALSLEAHRANRLANYGAYVDALARRDETLMMALAASQLNLAPADKAALVTSAEYITRSAGVFADLEPVFTPPRPSTPPDSLLYALSTRPGARMWVTVIGAVAVLYGLLPGADAGTPARRRRRSLADANGDASGLPSVAA